MKKNKNRDMLRSILPSKGRKGARHSRITANRACRRKVRESLGQYCGGYEDEDRAVLKLNECDLLRKGEIGEMVAHRRRSDKVNHFVRWCNEKTKHISDSCPKDKYTYMLGLLKGSSHLIKEHALGYFIHTFNPLACKYRYYGSKSNYSIIITKLEFENALDWCFSYCHKELNRALKGSGLAWGVCRVGDICISECVEQHYLYEYTLASGCGEVASWERPWSYHKGSLVKKMTDRSVRKHDERICDNRIMVTRYEDLARITEKAFKHLTMYRKGWWGGNRLIDQLIPLFKLKKLIWSR